MALAYADRIAARTRVEHADLPISAGCDEDRAPRVESETMDGVAVAPKDGLGALGVGEVPELDDVVAGRGREDVVGCGVEKDVADTARGDVDAGDGVEVLGLPAILAPAFEDGGLDLPDHGLAIFAGGGNDGVVEWGPVCVENGGGVAACEGDEVGEFGGKPSREWGEWRGEGKDGEGASAGRVPVQRNITLQIATTKREMKRGTERKGKIWVNGWIRTVEAAMTLVSQALLVTLTLSNPYSFFPFWPKTWLKTLENGSKWKTAVD